MSALDFSKGEPSASSEIVTVDSATKRNTAKRKEPGLLDTALTEVRRGAQKFFGKSAPSPAIAEKIDHKKYDYPHLLAANLWTLAEVYAFEESCANSQIVKLQEPRTFGLLNLFKDNIPDERQKENGPSTHIESSRTFIRQAYLDAVETYVTSRHVMEASEKYQRHETRKGLTNKIVALGALAAGNAESLTVILAFKAACLIADPIMRRVTSNSLGKKYEKQFQSYVSLNDPRGNRDIYLAAQHKIDTEMQQRLETIPIEDKFGCVPTRAFTIPANYPIYRA